MSDVNDDFTYGVESDEEETEVAFVVRSLKGKKITQEDLVDQMEDYLDEIYGRKERSSFH